jgi:beta-carotene hydroxylase
VSATTLHPDPPRLANLGHDLVRTSRKQRALSVVRPYLGIAGFVIAASFGLWWLLPLIVFAIFVSVVTVTHDVVHNALGLGRRSTEVALFALGAVLLESGHAYRITHRQHHRVFPGPDDPEGDPARLTFRSAVLYGPLFLPRLWWWALRRSRARPREQRWLLAEAAFALGYVAASILLLPITRAPLVYAALVIVGSWTYPLLTVHLPHRHYGETPLTQTHTLRGRIIPALFLELTYHLEHHLYPQVPSHNLPELARRLDPFLRQAGVEPVRVP